MLSIENRDQLRIDGELVPLVEQVVACVGCGGSIRAIERAESSLRQISGWIVFYGAGQRGIAINLEGVVPSRSNLRLRLNSIQHAQQVVAGFGGRDAFPLRLSDREECPADWPLYQVQVRSGWILCAASSPVPVLTAHLPIGVRRLPHAALTFIGHVAWDGIVSVGETRVMRALRVECPQQRLWGVITVSEEGVMKVQREEALDAGASDVEVGADAAGALVRLDIGEIELSLQEIMALRSGTAIDLKAEMPLRCFMRVGSTTLALGELALEDRGLVLRITEVMG